MTIDNFQIRANAATALGKTLKFFKNYSRFLCKSKFIKLGMASKLIKY